ncbi:MAG TPA: transketolase, partial [Propionibacteriaceae bacterium]|nr:transketolase [Propionibacteriaceae bacterium]
HLASLRAIPGLDVIRPADANETAEAWAQALCHNDRPAAMILTRQDVLTVDRSAPGVAPATDVAKGGYTLIDAEGPLQVVLIATGSEVEVALGARALLQADGIGTRV